MDISEADIRIINFEQEVLMDHLLELVSEALCHCLEGVIHLFCCFVVDEEFVLSLGRHVGGNVVRLFSWIEGQLKGIVEALDIKCFWDHDA